MNKLDNGKQNIDLHLSESDPWTSVKITIWLEGWICGYTDTFHSNPQREDSGTDEEIKDELFDYLYAPREM